MAWIELHQNLPTHRKILCLKNILNICVAQAVGHMSMLWLWALDNARDGDLSPFPNKDIAAICGWNKKADKFVNALIESGFVDENMMIHDWGDYTVKYVESKERDREQSRERQRRKREKDKESNADVTRDITLNVTPKFEDTLTNTLTNTLTTNKYTTHSNLPTSIILRVAGIKNRGPSAAEEEFEKKCQDRGYGEDMIRLAYDITIKTTGEYKVQYMAAIMERWHSEGVHTIEQAKQDTESRKKKGTSYSSDSYDFDDFFNAAIKRGQT